MKHRLALNLQLFAEDEGAAAPVVHAPVDAELYNEILQEQAAANAGADPTPSNTAGAGEGEQSVGTGTVDASKPDPKVGDAIKREVERREAKLKEQYEQQYGSLQRYGDYLARRARQEGFGDDVEGYLRAIDTLEQRMQAEEAARRMGVDPQAYQQYIAPVSQKAAQLEQELRTLKSQLTERQQLEEQTSKWAALYEAFPGLLESAQAFNEGGVPEWYNETMQGYINRGYDPVDAYRLAHADTIARQREQEVLARITGRDDRQVLSSNDSPANVQFDPANMTDKQLDELSARARSGERIVF